MKFKENDLHYDSITDAWPYILGQNFHWGYFESSNDSLEKATDNLIEKMVSYTKQNEKLNVLDVGCGIGGPAFYLHNKLKWKITGISNSEQGIDTASKQLKQLGLENQLKFLKRDALDNKFDENLFDLVWVMEMSHLIEDKSKLIEECYRVLKPNGRIILCDLTLQRPLTSKEIYKNQQELRILEKSFGKANLITLEQYSELFGNNKLKKIETINISKEVIPTITHWKENCEQNFHTILSHFSLEEYKSFTNSCDILSTFYNDGTWGYGIVTAIK